MTAPGLGHRARRVWRWPPPRWPRCRWPASCTPRRRQSRSPG